MRANHVKEKLLKGQQAFGTMAFEFLTPALPVILEKAGAEFVVYDMEHSGLGIDEIRRQLGYCRGTDLIPLVRVPKALPHLMAPVLDAGAFGLMLPMVESAEQAAEIVRATRYPPEGARGLAFTLPHDDFDRGDVVTKMHAENQRTLIFAQIESKQGLDNVEEIMAVPGIDVAWLGHFDLSLSLGIPGQLKHPQFLAALDRMIAASERNGKAAGCLVTDVAAGHAWLKRGFRAMMFSRDTLLLWDALSAGIKGLKELKTLQ
jgi:2-keto-3-deoxy-L-rhamnonate aldolase RhmA